MIDLEQRTQASQALQTPADTDMQDPQHRSDNVSAAAPATAAGAKKLNSDTVLGEAFLDHIRAIVFPNPTTPATAAGATDDSGSTSTLPASCGPRSSNRIFSLPCDFLPHAVTVLSLIHI